MFVCVFGWWFVCEGNVFLLVGFLCEVNVCLFGWLICLFFCLVGWLVACLLLVWSFVKLFVWLFEVIVLSHCLIVVCLFGWLVVWFSACMVY